MKRIAALIVVLSLFVSCDRSDGKVNYPVDNPETTQAQTESGTKHIGSVKLVGKSKRDGVKTIALASGLKSLLVSDGTIIGKHGVDLELLSLADFNRTASFTITDAMSDRYPWSSNSLAIAPNGSNVLLYNQYIDVNTFQPTIVLDIQPVIGRRNVRPIP